MIYGVNRKTNARERLNENGHQMMHEWLPKMQPNLRTQPFVIDPFEIKEVDALVVTHIHSDHLIFTQLLLFIKIVLRLYLLVQRSSENMAALGCSGRKHGL